MPARLEGEPHRQREGDQRERAVLLHERISCVCSEPRSDQRDAGGVHRGPGLPSSATQSKQCRLRVAVLMVPWRIAHAT